MTNPVTVTLTIAFTTTVYTVEEPGPEAFKASRELAIEAINEKLNGALTATINQGVQSIYCVMNNREGIEIDNGLEHWEDCAINVDNIK